MLGGPGVQGHDRRGPGIPFGSRLDGPDLVVDERLKRWRAARLVPVLFAARRPASGKSKTSA